MKIKKENIKRLIILLLITSLYPYYKYISTSSFVMFCDAFTIEGLILLLFGIFKTATYTNAFKSTSYIIQRTLFKSNKTYDAYLEDTKTSKTFNYPIYLGIADIIISFILSLFA